jgi:hypothetical protein
MIDYTQIQPGDNLRLVGNDMPGVCEIGELVRVVAVGQNDVIVETCRGQLCGFESDDGAACLEPTECDEDLPEPDNDIPDHLTPKVSR